MFASRTAKVIVLVINVDGFAKYLELHKNEKRLDGKIAAGRVVYSLYDPEKRSGVNTSS